MDLVNFNTWWSDFLADPRVQGAKDGGYNAVSELTHHIAMLSPDRRAEFVNELAGIACGRSEGWGLALGALEEHYSTQALARLASHVSSLRASTDLNDQSALSGIFRVLAKSADPNHRDLLAEYLLASPIGDHWSSVPWAVWPDDPVLFRHSWVRYFSAIPAARWRDTAIVQAFLSKPDALACVRDALRTVDNTAWHHLRDALLRQVDSSWLNEGDRERVRFVCEGLG